MHGSQVSPLPVHAIMSPSRLSRLKDAAIIAVGRDALFRVSKVSLLDATDVNLVE